MVRWSGYSLSLLALVPVPGDTYEEEHDVEDGHQGEKQDEMEGAEGDLVKSQGILFVMNALYWQTLAEV